MALTYTFKGEFGTICCTYEDYLLDAELRRCINDKSRYFLALGSTILTYDKDWLDGNSTERARFFALEAISQENPGQFFLPSGKEATAFLNDSEHDIKMLVAPNRVGKAKPVDSIVYTQGGTKRMGDCVVGDIILGGDGSPCKVTGVFPQGVKKLYRVWLDNNEISSVCCGEHQWKYLRHSRAFKHKENPKHKNLTFDMWEVLDTDGILSVQGDKASSQQRGYIPLAGAAQFDGNVPLDPYAFGCLLGDGSFRNRTVRITSADPEIVNRFRRIFGKSTIRSAGVYDYRISDGGVLRRSLQKLGLDGKYSHEKFIPKDFLYASADLRMELLRGLMDTDGTVDKRGLGCEFSTTSPRLANDVAWLVRSLGGKVREKNRQTSCNGKDGLPSYRVNVRMYDDNPFFVSRKHDRWRATKQRRDVTVCDIEEAGSGEAICISVDSKDSTFLCDDFVVTHNTASVVMDIAFLDGIPTNKEWQIFKNNGVNHRPWHGPLKIGVATYNWTMMQRTLWPEIRKWLPNDELGDYKRGGKDIPWRINPYIKLKCGTEIFFFVYEQQQAAFESQALHRWIWDEQGEEHKFDGGDERLRTLKGRHAFALTPHKLEGRPDTGARSWIHRLYMGYENKGHTVSHRCINVESVPDWVYPEIAKVQAFHKWVTEPLAMNNRKAIKEGRARFYGEWHDASGLVYDEWEEDYHLIDPFKIPDTWTRYRAMDHGINNPTACLWAAVSPIGDVYLYDEYYKSGLTVSENCRNIIEKSGNGLEKQGVKECRNTGVFFERVRELQNKERYAKTVIDGRTFGSTDPLTQMTLDKLYYVSGLRVQAAKCLPTTMQGVGVVKELMRVDPDKIHPITGKKGSPKIFVFRNLANFMRELRGYSMMEYTSGKIAQGKNPQEKPRDKDNHLMDALIYLCTIPPRYISDRWAFHGIDMKEREREREDREDNLDTPKGFITDDHTGY